MSFWILREEGRNSGHPEQFANFLRLHGFPTDEVREFMPGIIDALSGKMLFRLAKYNMEYIGELPTTLQIELLRRPSTQLGDLYATTSGAVAKSKEAILSLLERLPHNTGRMVS